MVRSISSKLSLVSAPGFLAKLKERSPSGEKVTNASVVNTDGSVNIPFVSIPAFSNVFTSSLPKASSPTFPRNAVFIPYLFNAARKFPGAPPGFAFIVGYPSTSVSFAAKSIRSSPRAITSYIPIPPCTHVPVIQFRLLRPGSGIGSGLHVFQMALEFPSPRRGHQTHSLSAPAP